MLNCYHAFVGLKLKRFVEKRNVLHPRLERLDRELLEIWYYRHAKNRFGHDISKPFDEPYVMYYPPPEDLMSGLVYAFLWRWITLKRYLTRKHA